MELLERVKAAAAAATFSLEVGVQEGEQKGPFLSCFRSRPIDRVGCCVFMFDSKTCTRVVWADGGGFPLM